MFDQHVSLDSSNDSPDLSRFPSIFADGDNVYDTFANPSDDPRKVKHYCATGAGTPRAKKSRA